MTSTNGAQNDSWFTGTSGSRMVVTSGWVTNQTYWSAMSCNVDHGGAACSLVPQPDPIIGPSDDSHWSPGPLTRFMAWLRRSSSRR